MDEIISVILLLFIFFFWEAHILCTRRHQIFKYGYGYNFIQLLRPTSAAEHVALGCSALKSIPFETS
jgi:hypothetical protein